MYICESLLFLVMFWTGVYSSYTDITSGIVKNQMIVVSAVAGVVINGIYYGLFANEYLKLYVVNLAVICLISAALYGFHYWAAGDSKLLVCLIMLFPARLYDANSLSPGLVAVLFIFLIAYFYIIGDTIVCFVRKKEFIAAGIFKREFLISFLKGFLVSFMYMRAISETERLFLGDVYVENRILFSLVNLFIAIFISQKNVFRKWFLILIAIVVNVLTYREIVWGVSSLYSYIILFIALLLRFFLSGYNYVDIPTEQVEKGMVLSFASVMQFMPSRIKGLPDKTTEDMQSRITEDEAEAIHRWKDSKYGKSTVRIVRKIPFAIFIAVGVAIYSTMRIFR